MINHPEGNSTLTSGMRAYMELEAMKVVKLLPDNQKRTLQRLAEDLIDIENLFPEPRQMITEEGGAVLRSVLINLKEAIEEGVPREVLLALLDRHFLEPIPADPGGTGKMAGG